MSLTEEGVANARAVAEKLQGMTIDKIVSSDIMRASVTAYLIYQSVGTSVEIDLRRRQ